MGTVRSILAAPTPDRPSTCPQHPAAAPSQHTMIEDADEATAILIMAAELEEAGALEDDSNGVSDLAMARRLHLDQLLSHRTLHGIARPADSETDAYTPVKLAHVAKPAADQVSMASSASDASSSPSPSPSAPGVNCTACEEPLPAIKAWRALCGHYYCLECLEHLFRACLTDQSLYPPKRCVVIQWQNVKAHLPAKLAADFEQKRSELDTPEHDRMYCWQPACSHFLGSRTGATADRGSLACPVCSQRTCGLCKASAHPGICAEESGDEALRQTLRLAGQQGWQTCRECQRVIESIPGGCTHEFCYACGARWRTCGCPQWNHAHLLLHREDEEEVDEEVLGNDPRAAQIGWEHRQRLAARIAALEAMEMTLVGHIAEVEQAVSAHEAEHAVLINRHDLWRRLGDADSVERTRQQLAGLDTHLLQFRHPLGRLRRTVDELRAARVESLRQRD